MNRILFLIGLSLSASRIFCADEIERRIQEEWDRLEYALPKGNYSDIHRFHERIAAFMGDACYRKLQYASKIFGETVDGTYLLMRDQTTIHINCNDLAAALKSFLEEYIAFNKIWQDMQIRYEEIYRLGTSVWSEKYAGLDIAQDLDALMRICSAENDQMLEQIDQIKQAVENIVDSIYSVNSAIVGFFIENDQMPELIDQIKEAVKNIIDPLTMALSNIIGFLEEYEHAIYGDGDEDESSFSQLVLPVGLSDMKF
jgi:hypothetical protein